jgi:hypothetical protein
MTDTEAYRPPRDYSDDERAFFATYRDERQLYAPPECHNGENCWVALGPPAITTRGRCIGCGCLVAAPRSMGVGR